MIVEYDGKKYDLEKLHTKQLLKLLKFLRVSYCECCHDPDWADKQSQQSYRLIPLFKEELSKREHIPNKKEAKLIRKEKSVNQQNQKNRKYRNR